MSTLARSAEEIVEVLMGEEDKYDGIKVKIEERMEGGVFASRLRASMSEWKEQMLVVQEKSGHFRDTGVWKIPTGVVEEGEDVYAAAKREVKEETGVEAEFVEIIGFSESHKAHFNKISDIFFVCVLEPKSLDITKQDSEILAAKWMPVGEYAAQPYVQERESMKKVAEMIQSKATKDYTGFARISVRSFRAVHSFYLNIRGLLN